MKHKPHYMALYYLISISMLLASCKATPMEPVVIQKNTDKMVDAALLPHDKEHEPESIIAPSSTDNDLYILYDIPYIYQNSLVGANGKMLVEIDAEVHLPNSSALPLVRVHAANFTQTTISSFLRIIYENESMYIPPKEVTKEKLEAQIARAQEQLQAVGLEDGLREAIKESIRLMQQQYEGAEDATGILSDGILNNGGLSIASTASGNGKLFNVQNNKDFDINAEATVVEEREGTAIDAPSSRASLQYLRNERIYLEIPQIYRGASYIADVTELHLSDEQASETSENILSISPKDAYNIAEEFLRKAGIHDMTVDSVKLISSWLPSDVLNMMVANGSLSSVQEYYNTTPQKQAYEIRCLRTVSNVKVSSDTFFYAQSRTEDSLYSKEWYYEECIFHIDDSGIATFSWTAPLETIDIVTEHANILPFSTIKDKFEKMIMVKNEPQANEESNVVKYKITDAVLSLQRVSEQNSYTTGLLIPVWNFYGTIWSSNEQGEQLRSPYGKEPYMTINAIDGSIIDPIVGY